MYCTSCGGKIPDDSQFCTICGQPLTQTQSNNQAYRQINPQQSQQYGSQQSQQYGGQQSQQYGGQQSQQYGGQQSQQYGSQQTNRQGKQQYGGGQNATAQGNSRGTMIAVIAICSLVIIAALAVLIYFKAAWKPTVTTVISLRLPASEWSFSIFRLLPLHMFFRHFSGLQLPLQPQTRGDFQGER